MKQMRTNFYKMMTMGLGILCAVFVCACNSSTDVMQNGQSNKADTEVMQTEVDISIPAWQRLSDEPITLDWYINYSWFATPWEKIWFRR